MSETRLLIVNADDFGLSPGVNRGILEGHRAGVITSASLMVRGAAAREAAGLARHSPDLAVGIHVEIAEWECRGGSWIEVSRTCDPEDPESIADAVAQQIEGFQVLIGRPPTHIDSHQHVHRREPALGIFNRWARELDIPLRDVTPGIRHCGKFYGQTAEGEPLPGFLTAGRFLDLAAAEGGAALEMACHPAAVLDFDSTYARERLQERAVLTDPCLRDGLRSLGFRLVGFDRFRYGG